MGLHEAEPDAVAGLVDRLVRSLSKDRVSEVALESTRARHLTAASAAHEEVALPLRIPVTGVERHAGRCDRWVPVVQRLLDAADVTVRQFAIEKLLALGAKPVSASDSSGFVHDPQGIDAEKLAFVMAPSRV